MSCLEELGFVFKVFQKLGAIPLEITDSGVQFDKSAIWKFVFNIVVLANIANCFMILIVLFDIGWGNITLKEFLANSRIDWIDIMGVIGGQILGLVASALFLISIKRQESNLSAAIRSLDEFIFKYKIPRVLDENVKAVMKKKARFVLVVGVLIIIIFPVANWSAYDEMFPRFIANGNPNQVFKIDT